MIFRLFLRSLELYNFRNHDSIKFFDLSDSPVVITGNNGAGKTNILEAVSLLTSSKGLKSSKIIDLNNHNYPNYLWKIIANVKTIYGLKEIVTQRYVKGPGKDSRLIYIDGQPIKKKSELNEIIKVVWLTPAMQQIFSGPSTDRRSFFDQIVSNFFPNHSTHLSQYDKSTKERLKLLKNNQFDDHWLSALEQNMFNEAGIISDARMQTLALLNSAIAENDTAFPKAILSLVNEPIQADFLLRQKHNRSLDSSTGRTNLGPHLFDMETLFKKKNMPAKFCSTGEQKALLLNIVLAQSYALISKFNIIPILLFDEVISHLDQESRSLLFDEILKIKSQAWLTGVDPSSFSAIKSHSNVIHLA